MSNIPSFNTSRRREPSCRRLRALNMYAHVFCSGTLRSDAFQRRHSAGTTGGSGNKGNRTLPDARLSRDVSTDGCACKPKTDAPIRLCDLKTLLRIPVSDWCSGVDELLITEQSTDLQHWQV